MPSKVILVRASYTIELAFFVYRFSVYVAQLIRMAGVSVFSFLVGHLFSLIDSNEHEFVYAFLFFFMCVSFFPYFFFLGGMFI